MLRIAHDLVVLGHQVTVFTGEWRTHPPIDGIQYKLLPTHGFTNHQRHQSLITAMQSAVIDDDFDFVVGFNRMAYLDAYYAADPCFMARAKETRGWWYRFTARYKFFATSEAAVFGALSNTQVLLLTQGDQTVFQRYYATPASRFHLLQPNIPLNKFVGLAHATCRHYLRLEFGLPAEAKVVMTVGSAYLRKGVDRTMQALASLPTQLKENTWLVSLGELESTSNFKRDAHRLGVAERCIEAGGRSDVAKLMMGADVLAHPARNELAGIVLIEALVAQLPVIVTDVCGYANHIQAAGGTVLPAPYSQESMNSALRLMLAEDNTHIKQAAQSYIASLIQLASTYAEANLLVKLASQQDVYATTQHDNVILPKRMLKHLRQKNLFDYFMQMQGKVFRDVSGRKTIQVSLNDQSYFIKQHFGVGWGEIAKNLITFKKPILSALTEVSAIKKLTKI
ncbi:MAG: glycosyltransferase, partial [Methylophilaceae bacterium]